MKSTAKAKWVVDGTVPPSSNQPWVFVLIPADADTAPSFYVMLKSDLRRLLMPADTAYRAKYQAAHGVDFTGKGVVSLSQELAAPYQNAWGTILKTIGL